MLMKAVEKGDVGVVQELVSLGCSVNATNKVINNELLSCLIIIIVCVCVCAGRQLCVDEGGGEGRCGRGAGARVPRLLRQCPQQGHP